MMYRFLRRVLRKHALFHLVIPLIAGILVEGLYTHVVELKSWSMLPQELLRPHDIALYVGVVLAYFVVIGILIQSETNIGLRHLRVAPLEQKLDTTHSLFAVATTPFEEWFDPAMQVYLAVLYKRKIAHPSFRYERVLLLPRSTLEKDLDSDYLDGYHAKCLIDVHKKLGIDLYFLGWREIREVLQKLTHDQKIHIGYYPKILKRVPERVAKTLMKPIARRRVRKLAVGVVEGSPHGTLSAFRFSKHDRVVDIEILPSKRSQAYVAFVHHIKDIIYVPNSHKVKVDHDFTKVFD